ncbi:hypothetical protein [Roseiflexus sp.]|uniref:hypothetical protein n=1 Tax=Roseiflexus sp. TaxID=2562120 RepID=UPI0025EB5371|nr:hypothetical protein [Roseiflexus sp.]MCL6541136.1 hypothetical protein [Roseiflexus sp.]
MTVTLAGKGAASPPARGGGQVVHPCGPHLNAHGYAIWTADQMQPPSKERLTFGGALPAACASTHLAAAPGARPAAHPRREAIKNEHVARGEHLPQHVRNSGHPIGGLMQTTIEARDADPSQRMICTARS